MTNPSEPLNRREVMTLGLGYALAVSPVTAWAIKTSSESLETAEVMIPTTGGESMPAYMAAPGKSGTYPCILVVHEIFGLHEYIKDVCRRLAKEGYVALSPYVYFRQGDATKIPDIPTLRRDIVSKVSQAQVLDDLDATVRWLGKQGKADIKRLGITGFCWGGTITWLYAAHSKEIKAGVAWYGRLSGEVSKLTPRFPLDVAASLHAPVLGLYGEKDQGIPLSEVDKMRELLQKAGGRSKIIVYEGADHGFHADYRPSYHPKAAKEGWGEMLAWFKQHGV